MTKVDLKKCIPMWYDCDTILLVLDSELGNDLSDYKRMYLNIEMWTDEKNKLVMVWASDYAGTIRKANYYDLKKIGLTKTMIKKHLLDFLQKEM